MSTIRAIKADRHVTNVRLSALRDRLPDSLSRERVDRALRELAQADKIMLHPNEDQKSITAADRKAAIRFGGELMHMVTIPAGGH
ncbi:MAG TPA: hypothetical protein VIV56_07495 [Gemmatimonadales bacterium]